MILEEVIVGGCVPALLKCYQDGIPIVLPCHTQPTIDLKFESEITIEQLTTSRHVEAWSMLKFLCAMRGLIINSNDLEYVRIEGTKVLIRGTEIEFKKCHFFPHNLVKSDLSIADVQNKNCYKIIDFMRLKFCDASNLVPIFPKEHFISRIESVGRKDIFSLSYLQKEQLTNFDYSDTMVRFIVEKLLQDSSELHRPLISKDSESRRKPKLEVLERKVLSAEEVVYSSTKKVKFYDRKKRSNIIKAYSRNCSSI